MWMTLDWASHSTTNEFLISITGLTTVPFCSQVALSVAIVHLLRLHFEDCNKSILCLWAFGVGNGLPVWMKLEHWEFIRFAVTAFPNIYSSSNSFGCCSNPLDHLLHDYWFFLLCLFSMSCLWIFDVGTCQNGSRGVTWDCMKVENLCTLLNFGVRHCCDYIWAWSSSDPTAFGNNFTFVVTVDCNYLSSDSDSSKKLHSNWPSSDNFLSKMVEVIQLNSSPKLNVLQNNFLKGVLCLVKFQPTPTRLRKVRV